MTNFQSCLYLSVFQTSCRTKWKYKPTYHQHRQLIKQVQGIVGKLLIYKTIWKTTFWYFVSTFLDWNDYFSRIKLITQDEIKELLEQLNETLQLFKENGEQETLSTLQVFITYSITNFVNKFCNKLKFSNPYILPTWWCKV